MIPSIAEPLFQDIGAKVEFHPVMVFEDLKKAIEHLSQNFVIVDTEQKSISVIISDTYQCFLFFVTNMVIKKIHNHIIFLFYLGIVPSLSQSVPLSSYAHINDSDPNTCLISIIAIVKKKI